MNKLKSMMAVAAARITFQQKMLIGLVITVFLITFISVSTAFYTGKLVKSAVWVEHTITVLKEAEQTLSLTKDIESGSRGYIITGDTDYLENFSIAKDSIQAHLLKLKELTVDNRPQQIRIDTLNRLVNKKIAFSVQGIKLREENGFQVARDLIATKVGKSLTDKIRLVIAEIQGEENRLLVMRRRENEKSVADFNNVLFILLAIGVIVLAILSLTIRHHFAARLSAEAKLQKSLQEVTSYKFALDESSIVAITDDAGIIKYANDNYRKISKYSHKELEDREHGIVDPRDHSEEFIRTVWDTISGGKIWKGEMKNRAKDGSVYWVDATIVPFPNEEGKPYQYLIIKADITNKKEAAEKMLTLNTALTTSEKRYRYLFENNPLPLWIIDLATFKFLDVNEAAITHYGYSRSEFLNMHATDIRPPEDRELFKNADHPLKVGVNYNRGSWRHLKKDGRIIVVEILAHEITFEDRPARLVLANDITERSSWEQKLVASEQRFRSTLDKMMEGVEIIGFDCRYLYVNEAYEKQVKYSKEELIGFTVMEKFPGIEKTGIYKTMERCFNERISFHYEDEYTFADQTTVCFEMSFQPVPEGVFILSVDTTERKKLQQQQAYSASIISSSNDAIISKDLNGIITTWNPGAQKIYGYTADEIMGKHVSVLIPLHLRDEQSARRQKIKQDENIGRYETERITKEGAPIYVSVTISPVKDTAGKVVGASEISSDITERRKAEERILKLNEELAGSEKRFRGLIENSYDIVAISDASGKPVYRSPASVRITGFTNEERAATEGIDQIHPDDLERFKNTQKEVMQNPEIPFPVSFRIKHKKGHYVFLEGMMTNMLQNEAIKGIVANFRDVTETRKAQEKLRQSERIYKTIASGIPGSVISLIDTDYRYLLVEGDLVEKLGYSKEMLVGNKVSDILTPQQFSELLPDFERVFSDEIFSYDSKRGDYHLLTKYVPLKDENDSVYAAMVVVIDITDLKKAERHILELNAELEQKVIIRTAQLETVNQELEANIRQVKESEEKFSKIFGSSPVGISIGALPSGIIIDVNKSFLQLTGFQYEEIIGHTSNELNLIDTDDRETIKNHLTTHGKVREKEAIILNKKGEKIAVLLSLDQFVIGNDKYAITIAYDISERKKAEQQLGAANKELEAFTYSVSHDLRAPLRAVDGYAKILEEDYGPVFDFEGIRLLREVQYNAKKMGTLIDDLLAFSRLGRKEVKKSMIDMNELTESALAIVKGSETYNAVIKYDELPSVMGDFSLMEHVMVNLLSNAIKYSSKSEQPLVEIKSRKENGEVIYAVCDNGVGFDMQYAHKLFGVFQRLHSNEEFPGTGVGLAIAERIIQKHKGRIWAEAAIDKGATFFFSLPSDDE